MLFFGVTEDKRALGYTAGFFISAFMLGRMISSYPLGLASDIYGRRAVIQLGLVSCLVFQLLFGLAPTFGTAILTRFLMGAFNGIIGVSKAAVPELVPPADRARAMSAITGMWGLGTIFGPALGGLLWIPGSPGTPCFWSSVVGAAISAVALVAVGAYMPNTRGRSATAPPGSAPSGGMPVRGAVSRGVEMQRAAGAPSVALPVPDDNASPLSPSGKPGLSECSTAATGSADGVVSSRAAAATPGAVGGATERQRFLPAGPDSEIGPAPRLLLGVPAASLPPTAIYCLLSVLTIIIDEIVPLWCVAPRRCGGLGLEAHDIGAVMSISGLVLVVFQLFLYPLVAARFPTRRVFEVGLLVYGVLSAAMPFLALLAAEGDELHAAQPTNASAHAGGGGVGVGDGGGGSDGGGAAAGAAWAVVLFGLISLNSLGKCAGSMAYTSIFLVINNSAGDEYRGRVNGLGMSAGSAFKAAGPTLGAVLFAWSITGGQPSADGQEGAVVAVGAQPAAAEGCGASHLIGAHFTFNVCAVLSLLTAAAAQRWLSPDHDEPSFRAGAGAKGEIAPAAAENGEGRTPTPGHDR